MDGFTGYTTRFTKVAYSYTASWRRHATSVMWLPISKDKSLGVLQFLAYLIIALAVCLCLGGAIFLAALRVYDCVEEWRVERKNR